jgi:hypothetical protein
VDSTGTLHSGWPAGGIVLGTLPATTLDLGPSRCALVRSGADRVIVSWPEVLLTGERRLRLKCYTSAGTPAADWPASGVIAASGEQAADFSLLADGGGGVYVMWFDYNEPFAPVVTHVRRRHLEPGLDASGGARSIRGAIRRAAQRQLRFGRYGRRTGRWPVLRVGDADSRP